MNRLTKEKQAMIASCLVEGNSIRATVRLTDVSKNTIAKLLRDLGTACSADQDKTLRNLNFEKLQADEIWSFIGAKERNTTKETKADGWGDVWTWIAMDADTKLVPCWFVGTRDAGAANHFIQDLSERLASRVQLTTDGHKAYLSAVEESFGCLIDYAMLVKLYGKVPTGGEVRYSPAICMGARRAIITGKPERKYISTRHVERQNLTMRMSMCRFTRLTNGFSKTLEQHENALALYYTHYNFARIHQTLRVTPAMEAGVSDHVWSLKEIVGLL